MNIGEASRQYQIALEHKRTARSLLSGVLSAEDEIAEVTAEEARMWRQVWLQWVELPAKQIGVA